MRESGSTQTARSAAFCPATHQHARTGLGRGPGPRAAALHRLLEPLFDAARSQRAVLAAGEPVSECPRRPEAVAERRPSQLPQLSQRAHAEATERLEEHR